MTPFLLFFTRVHGEQSEQLMDLRINCLDQRLGDFKALIHVFARGADNKVLDQAVQAVANLPSLKHTKNHIPVIHLLVKVY